MRRLLLPVLSLLLVSCQSTSIGPSDQVRYPDMSALVERVKAARSRQQAAVKQFQSARENLAGLAAAGSADLQTVFARTVAEYDASVAAAVAVRTAIAAVDQAANSVFQEWQVEVDVYTDPQLKAANQARLGETWQGYQGMLQVMRQAEAKMDPVLKNLNDNVNYLQDKLSTSAVASRNAELVATGTDIAALLRKLNIAIDSSSAFIASVP